MISDPIIAELINHLWQSTLLALAAGLLTLAFRKNRAQIRHGLWLTASLKFLVPFSVLMSLGGHLQWAPAAKTMATQAVSYTMEEITQPFPASLPPAPAAPRGTDWLPIAIVGVWACGFGVIALMRLKDWLRIRAAVRASTPLEMAAVAGAGVEVRSYPGLLEPGVVGLDVAGPFGFRWSRPILLLPAGIVDRLTRPQMEAIFAHELCHVRRRDNLTAAIHMVVETAFWFHPLVWWLGARLVEERERACDEEVLRQGGEPQVYAEAILNVCKFYVESPLACMSGVTGSDLKKRIERIMKERLAAALSARKKFLLVAAAVLALVLPVAAGMLTAPRLGQSSAGQSSAADANRLAFDAASIKVNATGGDICARVAFSCWMDLAKPGILTGVNQSLRDLVVAAYALTPAQARMISGAPKWMGSERFDIQATAGGNPGKEQKRMMLQSLLADRFKLALHRETRQGPIYALVQAKAGKMGPGLTQHSNVTACIDPNAPRPPKLGDSFCGGFLGLNRGGLTDLTGNNTTMVTLAEQLGGGMSGDVDRPVADRTGLNGTFDITLEYTPRSQIDSGATTSDPAAPPSIFTALQEQLGLKLVPSTGPVDVLVIDHVEEPSDNSGQAPAEQSPAAAQSAAPASGKVAFEVASIKLNRTGAVRQNFQFPPDSDRFTATNLAARDLIQFAFYLQDYQLSKGPGWMNSNRYDISATIPESTREELRKLNRFEQMEQVQRMLQSLLADRFKLKVSHDTKKLPVYALVVAKDGGKLTPNTQPDPLTSGPKEPSLHLTGGGQITGSGVPVSLLADILSKQLGRKVVDKTGLKGNYDFKLQWIPDESQAFSNPDGATRPSAPPPDSSGPSIFTALQEQLGLKLESQTGPVDFLVIDHVEEPSPN